MIVRNILITFPSRLVKIRNLATATLEDNYIVVKDSKKSMKFPQIWLRDNCRCSECFHETTHSRIHQFDIKVQANKIKTLNEIVEIEWSDQHNSTFDLKWLKEREFNAKNHQKFLNEFYQLKQSLWSKDDYEKILQKFEFNEIIETREGLVNWIEAVAVNGVAMIENVPQEKGSVRKLCERVGFIKKTNYGEEFIVSAKPDTKNYAYLSEALPLHTDLPFYEYKPGLNFLHCFTQSNSIGGQSLIADGFYAADRLKKEDPESFEILNKTPVNWYDIGKEANSEPFHCIYRMPVINLNKYGRYTRINHNVPQRDSYFTVNLEVVIPWYRSYSKYLKILKEETYSFKLHEGQLFTFNNLRLLHGRTGYDDSGKNVRYLIGAYMDWDIVFARWRFLKGENECEM